ncbi:uncharacterized protein ACJ7VT_010752 [Polymixia lowei]
MNYSQLNPGQSASVNGKHYEWHLSDGSQWLHIDNDHVIETHYCQPGAKGMTINTATLGQVYIDFDQMTSQNGANGVKRLTFLPQDQIEDIGWYFRDENLWCEYGSQSTNTGVSSVSSRDLEQQYALNSQRRFSFTVGPTAYYLDFSVMVQTNCVTGVYRNVRRRPKFASIVSSAGGPVSVSALPTNTSSHLPADGHIWEYMGDEGEWKEYQIYENGSLDSAAIERHYQQNPLIKLHFRIRKFSYTLDLSEMYQVNDNIGTVRTVRRTSVNGSHQSSSAGTLPRWQFQDVDGAWKDYGRGRSTCSLSSMDIENQYQQNPTGTIKFSTRHFSYELNFSAMTQRNLSTNTTRSVQRLSQ